MDAEPSLFELLYRAFLAAGGFARPALTEDTERTYRSRQPPLVRTCEHGKTPLTCEQCYFLHGDSGPKQ